MPPDRPTTDDPDPLLELWNLLWWGVIIFCLAFIPFYLIGQRW